MQPMAASVGHLADERARLEREIAELSSGLPPGAAEVVRAADELMAEHGRKLAELKAKRDAIDAKFSVTAREAAEAREREDAEARAALVAQLNAAAAAYYDRTDRAEEALAAFVLHVTEAVAAHAEMRRVAHQLARGAKVPMAFDPRAMIGRLGGRVGGMLRKIRVPDQGITVRLGPLQLPEEPASPRMPPPGEAPVVLSWREKEQAALGDAVAQVAAHGGR